MKSYLVLLLALWYTTATAAYTPPNDTPTPETATTVSDLPPMPLQRSFAQLETKIARDIKQLEQQNVVIPEFSERELTLRFESAKANELRGKAEAVIQELEESDKFLSSLSEYLSGIEPITLPIGIKKNIGNSKFIMGVSKIQINQDYAELEIFVRITLPQIDKEGKRRELFFGATGVKLSHKGGLFGDADLALLGDYPIQLQGKSILMILKGGYDLETGSLEKKTYVTIDCDGFKEMGLQADVEFSRKKLLPVKPDNTIDDSTIPGTSIKKKVRTSFAITASDWNDILVDITLPRFQVPSLKNTVFELNTAVFDFSDLRNSDKMKWPTKEYTQNYLIPGEEDLWRGVYVQSLTVVLPKQFKKRGSTAQITFGAKNLLIDNNGVSGIFSAQNVLPIKDGDAGGWQFSVDGISLTFVAGNFTGGGFDGQIVLPVSTYKAETKVANTPKDSTSVNYTKSNSTALAYSALIDAGNNEYTLTANPLETIAFDVFKARATLTNNSYIELKLDDGKFKPKAVLHGNLAIKGSNSGSSSKTATADFEGIIFRDFQMQTVSPKLSIGYAGYTGEIKVGNFPASISDIGIRAGDNIAALDFTFNLNLMDSGGFSGSSSLSVEGELGKNQGLEKWKFKRIKLRRVEIAADLGFKLEGFVEFRENDPVYGDGFAGMVHAEFSGGIAVTINAVFGKTDFRYWYVDGLVEGLNIVVPTGLAITGFGGGAAYRMKKEGYSSNIGIGKSGVKYVPDRDSGLTVKAMMLFSVAGGNTLVNGGFGFEMAFNRRGGINRISLYGEAHMLQDLGYDNAGDEISGNLGGIIENEENMAPEVENQLKETNLMEASKAIYPAVMSGQKGLNAYVAIEVDFQAKTFHGTFELYIDVIGGVFKGVGPGGRAGWSVVHFGPGEWYIHVGTPTDPVGVKIGIGSIALTSKSYFMMGDYMPAAPPPPSQVARILGLDASVLDYMRDENALKGGRGLAFGSSLDFDTGDMTFLFMYARFNAGFGFDIMVKDYGDTMCAGSGQIGVNGWYANGQSYVYLQGSLGIKFKLFGKRKRIVIIDAGVATLMQAKLPNPVWFRGYLGGYYRVLGGLIKGRFRFEMQFGEECEIVGGRSPLQDIKIIADIQPRDKSGNVDVFAVPQVAFNMQVGKEFRLEDEEFKVRYYRFKLNDFWIKDDQGKIVEGTQEINENNDLLSFTSEEVLPPEKAMQLHVSVTFEEKTNGKWIPVTFNGDLLTEEETINFTTGTAPDHIPQHNIAYCYPVIEQQYFLPKEHPNSYMVLKRGQSYLFNLQQGWQQRAFFLDEFDQAIATSLRYNAAQKKVSLPLPELSNTESYTLKLLTIPPAAVQANVSDTYTSTDAGNGNTIETKSKSIEGLTTNPETIEMLSYEFKTSAHNTFKEKIKAKRRTKAIREIIYADIHALQADVRNSEPFDLIELSGSAYTENKPLITAEAILDDAYYTTIIYPLIYKNYPLRGEFTVDRDPSILGFPPTKTIEKMAWYEAYLENYPDNGLLTSRMAYRYNAPTYYSADFLKLQYKITDDYIQNPQKYASTIDQYLYIIDGYFPYITSGDYKTKFTYLLPGNTPGTSEIFTFNNPN